MKTVQAASYPVSIFVAGDYDRAITACREFCDKVGLCVTVTPTMYTYTDGCEEGVIVGLINYPRFPQNADDLTETAFDLGMYLRDELGQGSFSVQTPKRTTWFSWREADQISELPQKAADWLAEHQFDLNAEASVGMIDQSDRPDETDMSGGSVEPVSASASGSPAYVPPLAPANNDASEGRGKSGIKSGSAMNSEGEA